MQRPEKKNVILLWDIVCNFTKPADLVLDTCCKMNATGWAGLLFQHPELWVCWMWEGSQLGNWGNVIAGGDVFHAASEQGHKFEIIRRCFEQRQDSGRCFELSYCKETRRCLGCSRNACGRAEASKEHSHLQVDVLQVWLAVSRIL